MISYSIIIPHHNTPDLLSRLLNSIPQRDDIEIIIVDDNSDFDKRANVSRYDVKSFYIDKNSTRGAGHARNIGMEHARGEWLLFADADDFFLSEAWLIIDKYKQSIYDIVYFGIESVDSKTLVSNERKQIYGSLITTCLANPSIFNMTRLKCRHDVPWGKMIRHSLITKNNILFGETKYCNDTLFSTKSALAARSIAVEEKSIYCVTSEPSSLTHHRSIEANYIRLEVILQKNKLLREHGMGEHQISILHYLRESLNYSLIDFFKHLFLVYRYKTSIIYNYIISHK